MTLLVATDFSAAARPIVDLAAGLARRRGDLLLLAHVVDGPVLPAHQERLVQEEKRLAALGAKVEGVVESGGVADTVAAIATRKNADLVVVGAQGEGLRRLLGTVATAILHRVDTPLLVVRAPERLAKLAAGEGVHVLLSVPLDETEPPLKAALAFLASLGPVDADAAHYRLVPEPAAARHDAVRLGARDAVEALEPIPAGVKVTPIVRDGFGRLDSHVVDLTVERGADLVVCGSHRRHGLERIQQGSVAEGIVRHAPVSVLVAARGKGT